MTTPVGTAEYNDAYELLTAKLREWGIDGLDQTVQEILTQGYSPDVASLRLQDTPQYKERFAANQTRIKNGLPVLSPAEYISTERAYQQTLREYGLPSGFYDDVDDYRRWIAEDVSPQEMSQRAQTAQSAYLDASPEAREQWQNLYGLTPGDAVAVFLDQTKALPVLQKRAEAVTVAAEAERAFRGQYQISQARAEELVDAGVDQGRAQAGFRDVASRIDRDKFLGRLAGQDFTQKEAEDEVLLNDTTAKAERDRIYGAEKARFNQNYLPTTQAGLARDESY